LNLNDLQKLALTDSDAEKQLFELLAARFRSIARRNIWDSVDCEDAVQSALAAVFSRYKTTTYSTSFSAWAYGVLQKIVVNHNAERMRWREKHADLLDNDDANIPFEPDPDLEIRILDCFRKLSRRNKMYARIINFSYQGYNVPDICKRVGLTRTNFYSILSRSRSLLMQCIKKGEI
jgi:RNA polymerase sigma factor (sigma-70 family)